jgi:hypothetical protein
VVLLYHQIHCERECETSRDSLHIKYTVCGRGLICSGICDGYNKFSEVHGKLRAASSWEDHGICVLGLRKNGFMLIFIHSVTVNPQYFIILCT